MKNHQVKLITDQELEALNTSIVDGFGTTSSGFYSGCNYFRNRGTNEYEPLGTCTSMHDCDSCQDKGQLNDCQMKKPNPIWREEAKILN